MKRLFIVASLAIAAIGCQKTEVQNEVLTPIGFNTEIGKQTRAINDESTVIENYGVFSYLYNDGVAVGDPVMINQEVSISGYPVDATYYWPNDPDNHLNFYAYSPKMGNQVVGMSEEGILVLTDYEHTNYYGEDNAVDFMVADLVKEAQYSKVYAANKTYGAGVPINFHHELTQVLFEVEATEYENVSYTLEEITFNDAVQKSTYTYVFASPFVSGSWDEHTLADIEAFPIDKEEKDPHSEDFEIYPLTMIPVTPESITVKYTITANGATENVEEIMSLPANQWAANKKITYKLSIGLHPISFIAEVASWGTNQDVPFVADSEN